MKILSLIYLSGNLRRLLKMVSGLLLSAPAEGNEEDQGKSLFLVQLMRGRLSHDVGVSVQNERV